MNFVFSVVCIVFICVLLGGVNCQKPLSCAKSSINKLDAIFAKLLVLGDTGRTFPKTIDELPMFCNASLEMIKTIDSHNQRCNKKITKQVMSLSVFTARQQMANTCRSGKKQKQLLAAFPCANRSNKPVAKCMTALIDAMIGAQNLPDTHKIPSFCCDYYRFKGCASRAYDRTKGCRRKHKESLIDLMESTTSQVLTLLCADYDEDSDKCRSLLTPKRLKSQKRTKSFFIPLTQLLHSFRQ